MIIDQHKREHNYLRISLTEKCNLRCQYCMPADGIPLLPSSHLMQVDEIFTIAQKFVALGTNKIRLTGGEPLVRKDFERILRKLATLPVELAISTNGVLVDRFLDLFMDVGLMKLNISLDTLQEDKFKHITRRNDFKKVIQNIDLCLQNGFEVKLNVVVMRGFNEDEILDFIKLTQNKKLEVRFIEFMPFDGNNWDNNKLVSLQNIITLANNKYGETLVKLKDHLNDTTKNYQVKGFEGTWGVISTVTSPFCSGCNRMRLTADGKMKNCLFDNNEMDLLGALRDGKSIQNLIKMAVWNKFAIRGGMDTPEKFSDAERNQDNRSMIAIGG